MGADVAEPPGSVTTTPARLGHCGSSREPLVLVVGSAASLAPAHPGRAIAFGGTLVIGRHAARESESNVAGLVLQDRLVSSRHALIAPVGGEFQLTDLGSTNGTVVDGVLARLHAPLHDGSIVFVGGHVLVFRMVTGMERLAILHELKSPFGPVGSASPGLAVACEKLRKLASSPSEILITGETGTGKEVYARAIHSASGRRGRFVAINCAALPRELVESELFGCVRGAHSQAWENKPGLIEEADGGSIFLDEIGEMPPELQTKLLRFAQDRQFIPVGGTRSRLLDVRILAATSRTTAPSAGVSGLRGDLAARLGAEAICLPPLRERIEDIGALAAHFLGAGQRPFDTAAFQAMCFYGWPGNVRELEKVVASADVLSRGAAAIGFEHLPAAIASVPGRARAGGARRPPPTISELEGLFRRFSGNVLRIAREMDRKPAQIYRWARRFRLDPDDYRGDNT